MMGVRRLPLIAFRKLPGGLLDTLAGLSRAISNLEPRSSGRVRRVLGLDV